MKALYKVYGDRRPCGAVTLSNCFGLLVFEPTEEDRPDTDFITAWSDTEGKTWGFHRNKVHYTPRACVPSQRFFAVLF